LGVLNFFDIWITGSSVLLIVGTWFACSGIYLPMNGACLPKNHGCACSFKQAMPALSQHPGGMMTISLLAGQDATSAYDETGHSNDAMDTVHRLAVARLSPGSS
jgi:hypothetical protein